MRISPLDVRSQDFKKSLRGYDPEEVKAFLDTVADTLEDLLKEKETADAQLVALKKRVETFTSMEISLRDAMVAAQKAADDAKSSARRNVELMIREAELEVRQRIADAKRRVDDVFRTRDTVRAEMRAFLPRLRSLLESQLTYLASIEDEIISIDLGEGGAEPEMEDVQTLAQTVESRAKKAELEAREESVRHEERRVERSEHIAAEHAVKPEHHGVPAQGQAQQVQHAPPAAQHDEPAQGQAQQVQHAPPAVQHGEPAQGQAQQVQHAPPAAQHGELAQGQAQQVQHAPPAAQHGEPAQGQAQQVQHAPPAAQHEQQPAGDSTWRPAPSFGEQQKSDEELGIPHTPKED